VCDLETSRMGAPYIYDISRLRVNRGSERWGASELGVLLVAARAVV